MRFMKIEARVRLKNFEHIVDLIESDGGELIESNYVGNGKSVPVQQEMPLPKRERKTKRKRKVFLSSDQKAELIRTKHNHPEMTFIELGKMFNISASSAAGTYRRRAKA